MEVCSSPPYCCSRLKVRPFRSFSFLAAFQELQHILDFGGLVGSNIRFRACLLQFPFGLALFVDLRPSFFLFRRLFEQHPVMITVSES